jgi:hypothetical protein
MIRESFGTSTEPEFRGVTVETCGLDSVQPNPIHQINLRLFLSRSFSLGAERQTFVFESIFRYTLRIALLVWV